jgi:hypothetical protein
MQDSEKKQKHSPDNQGLGGNIQIESKIREKLIKLNGKRYKKYNNEIKYIKSEKSK